MKNIEPEKVYQYTEAPEQITITIYKMKNLFRFLRAYWLAVLIASVYVVAFSSYLIEPCALNMMLVILLTGVAVIVITHYLYDN